MKLIITKSNSHLCTEILCQFFGLSKDEAFMKSRDSNLVKARHLIRAFLKLNSDLTCNAIGNVTRSDHTSVSYAVSEYEKYSDHEAVFEKMHELLLRKLPQLVNQRQLFYENPLDHHSIYTISFTEV